MGHLRFGAVLGVLKCRQRHQDDENGHVRDSLCCKKWGWNGPLGPWARTALPLEILEMFWQVGHPFPSGCNDSNFSFQQCLKTIFIIGNWEVCLTSAKSHTAWKCAAAVVDRIVATFFGSAAAESASEGMFEPKDDEGNPASFLGSHQTSHSHSANGWTLNFWVFFFPCCTCWDKIKLYFQGFWCIKATCFIRLPSSMNPRSAILSRLFTHTLRHLFAQVMCWREWDYLLGSRHHELLLAVLAVFLFNTGVSGNNGHPPKSFAVQQRFVENRLYYFWKNIARYIWPQNSWNESCHKVLSNTSYWQRSKEAGWFLRVVFFEMKLQAV